MKNSAFLFLFAILLVTACDVLDVDPYHSIPADEAVRSKNDVISAINGTYASLQSAGYYGRNYIVAGDLSADNLEWTGTTAGYNQMDNNSILADNVIVEGIWSSIYTTISRANNLIAQLPIVDDITETERNEFMAELLFMRALGHFDLARMFGPVPVRTSPADATDEGLNAPRQPLNVVYSQIFEDLEFAKDHIRQDNIRGLASRASALALLARTKLYYYSITGQEILLEEAAGYAGQVIEEFGLSLEPSFVDLFSDTPNSESIFEVDFTEQDRNRLAEYFFPTSLSGRREFAPTEELFDAFSGHDIRRDASIASDGTNLYCIKYSDIETGADNVYVLRLAEMYLIRAESYALLGVSLDQARDDINAIRLRAGLQDIQTTDPALLLDHVAEMRQLEFAFEGHRWFDLVRTSRAVEELETLHEECRMLFPIPLGELLTNFHEGMYQNDCY